jgi:hypothetical protein
MSAWLPVIATAAQGDQKSIGKLQKILESMGA